MNQFRLDELVIEARPLKMEGKLRVDWRGKSSAREPTRVLLPFFESVARDAAASKASMEMHFEGIEHFNSSTITAIIHLIQLMRKQGTPLVLIYDPEQKWQRLSFEALRVFEKGDGLLRIETVS
ncbi:MAG: hypothetical protein P1V51_02985 [Deltaproteobacteria bacterium]|nr:hypothetical protein [Deltaproteobacteria bacterium]